MKWTIIFYSVNMCANIFYFLLVDQQEPPDVEFPNMLLKINTFFRNQKISLSQAKKQKKPFRSYKFAQVGVWTWKSVTASCHSTNWDILAWLTNRPSKFFNYEYTHETRVLPMPCIISTKLYSLDLLRQR